MNKTDPENTIVLIFIKAMCVYIHTYIYELWKGKLVPEWYLELQWDWREAVFCGEGITSTDFKVPVPGPKGCLVPHVCPLSAGLEERHSGRAGQKGLVGRILRIF